MSVTSVLLAAGRGTRLRPLTETVPKPALPLVDVPLAAYALGRLLEVAPPVVINVSHLGEVLEGALESHVAGHPVTFFRERPAPLGAAGTLRSLASDLADPFVTHNADALCDVSVAALLDAHALNDADATIAVRRVERGADFLVSAQGELELLDRTASGDHRGVLFLGVAVWNRGVVDLVPNELPAGLAEHVLGPLARAGRLALHEHDGYWRDVGTPSAYLAASLDVVGGTGPAPPDGLPGQIIEVEGGGAYVGPEAHVRGAQLGTGAIVLAGATVEPGARVEHAVVLPGERVRPGAHLSRCIWARGSAVAAPDPDGTARRLGS